MKTRSKANPTKKPKIFHWHLTCDLRLWWRCGTCAGYIYIHTAATIVLASIWIFIHSTFSFSALAHSHTDAASFVVHQFQCDEWRATKWRIMFYQMLLLSAFPMKQSWIFITPKIARFIARENVMEWTELHPRFADWTYSHFLHSSANRMQALQKIDMCENPLVQIQMNTIDFGFMNTLTAATSVQTLHGIPLALLRWMAMLSTVKCINRFRNWILSFFACMLSGWLRWRRQQHTN